MREDRDQRAGIAEALAGLIAGAEQADDVTCLVVKRRLW